MDNNTEPRGGVEKVIAFFGRNFPLIVIGGLVFYFWGIILPFVLAVLEGSLLALVYVAVFALIVLLAMSPEVRMVSYNLFRKITRGMVEAMVKIDPLGNMKTYRDDIRDKELPNIQRNLSKISGLVQRTERQIREFLSQRDKYLSQASVAKQKGDKSNENLFEEQAGTYESSAKNLQPMLMTIQNQESFYKRVKELAEYMYKKLCTVIEVKETEFALITEGQAIMGSAKKAMGKDPRFQMFQDSSKEIANKFDSLVGDMKALMEDSQKHFVDMDYEKAANAEAGKDLLAEFEARRQNILNKIDEPVMLPKNASSVKTLPTASAPVQQKENVRVNTNKKLF